MHETPLSPSGISCQQILQLTVDNFRKNYFRFYKQTIANSGAKPARVAIKTPECKGFEMNSDKQISYELHTSASEPSSNRRNLLKAAATIAPFIGTLPSGAALANASSVQCALLLQQEAGAGRPIPAKSAPDNFYRVAAKTWDIRLPPTLEPAPVYQFTALDESTVVRVDGSGNTLTVTGDPPAGADNVYLLVLYVPVNDPLNVPLQELALDGDKPATCNIPSGKGFSAPPGTYCIHPIAQLEGGNFGNMGMTASCLTSFVAG